jgi:hypothetical protein
LEYLQRHYQLNIPNLKIQNPQLLEYHVVMLELK